MDRVISLIRYRFFLFAGIFPYFLGQAIAYHFRKSLNWQNFWLGFLGIFLCLCGVELFNEYFDAKEGGDRIFLKEEVSVPHHFYRLGVLVFIIAFCIGIYLTLQAGWPILLFSFLGFSAAYFYVGPPIKWAYRGLGEIVIALSYGPLMLLGSYYLQAEKFDFLPVFSSLICAAILFCLAIVNEIPDYYQDRLVGKMNLVVRLGKERVLKLLFFGITSVFFLLALGMILKIIPLMGAVTFLMLPLIFKNLAVARRNYENPEVFLSAINANIALYLTVSVSLGIGYLYGA